LSHRRGESDESFRFRRASYMHRWRGRRGLARKQKERETNREYMRRQRLEREIAMWCRALGWSGEVRL
jgi:hypothetical protein